MSEKIVILGGGFAGIYAYLELHKRFHRAKEVDITLISDRDQFLFVPLIHEVATGALAPNSVSQSIRQIPACCLNRFIEARVVSADFDKKVIYFQRLPEDVEAKRTREMPYDYLISGLGSDTNYFNTPGAEKYAFDLKNLDDARRMKNKIIDNFEEAQFLSGVEQKNKLRFTIIGGGPTGVEVAGELADMISRELRKAFPTLQKSCGIVILQGSSRLVPQVERWFSEQIEKILCKKMNVEIKFNERAQEVRKNGVLTESGFIKSGMVIWAAGVKANKLKADYAKSIEYEKKTERIRVTNFLNLKSYPNIFVAGDQAWICDKEAMQPYPMRAQFAVREGEVAARNIWLAMHGKKLREFVWKDAGFIISLGKGGALAKIFGIKFTGFFAWWLYRTAYLLKLVGLRAKFRTALEWTLNLFLPRDISKL